MGGQRPWLLNSKHWDVGAGKVRTFPIYRPLEDLTVRMLGAALIRCSFSFFWGLPKRPPAHWVRSLCDCSQCVHWCLVWRPQAFQVVSPGPGPHPPEKPRRIRVGLPSIFDVFIYSSIQILIYFVRTAVITLVRNGDHTQALWNIVSDLKRFMGLLENNY